MRAGRGNNQDAGPGANRNDIQQRGAGMQRRGAVFQRRGHRNDIQEDIEMQEIEIERIR